MNDHDHDDLWDLLGRARKPDVSPFFSRNILREIREDRGTKGFSGILSRLRRQWRFASAAGAVAALILAGVMVEKRSADQASLIPVVKIAESPDYEVIAELDTLIASENNSLWLEESVTF